MKNILFTVLMCSLATMFQVALPSARLSTQAPNEELAMHSTVFTKGLEHDQNTGLLTTAGQLKYEELIKAAAAGDQKVLKSIVSKPLNRSFVYTDKLGSYDDFPLNKIPPFPALSTKEAAAQLTEVYLQALARDVLFHEYGTGKGSDKDADGRSITGKALPLINDYGKAYKGPGNSNNKADAQRLFRGNYVGAEVGPYISQFLYIPVSQPVGGLPTALGFTTIPPCVFQIDRLQPIPGKRNFGILYKDYIELQDGKIPQPYKATDFSEQKRFISSGRDLASYVHFDYPFHPIYQAVQILYAYKFTPPASVKAKLKKEGFEKMGYLEILGLINDVSSEVEKAVSAYKWQGQRIMRPEEFANLVHQSKMNHHNNFSLSPELFKKHSKLDLLEWVRTANKKEGADTYLLSQAYPEGAPLHPSYPSGHAAYMGAYITILKAVFNDTAPFSYLQTPVKPDPKNPAQLIALSKEGEDRLTIGGELNKLASNLAFGRNFAGIHYRADADYGMRLGEQVALTYLKDRARTFPNFKGFELTTLDGKRMRIAAKKK